MATGAGGFLSVKFAYWPEAAIISQQWQPPAVQKVTDNDHADNLDQAVSVPISICSAAC